MKELITTSPLFGIAVSIFAYTFGTFLHKRFKAAIVNPLLISYILIIGGLVAFDIPFSAFNEGGAIINMFLLPVTTVLALTIYDNREIVLKNLLPIIVGTTVGALVSIGTVLLGGYIFNLDAVLVASLVPKSVTTPIAISIVENLGGYRAITIISIMFTGVCGNVFAPLMIKLFRVKDPLIQGVAIGTVSHAVGTSKAVELGEIQGALSGIALTFSGIAASIAVLIYTLF